MANEELTIAKDKARLSVIGNSYPDTLTNSGEGLDIPQLIIDILTDLDIDLPDIDPDDWDNLPIVIGLDEDDMPVIEFPDPDFDPDLHPGELPDIIDWPLPDLDWDDLIAGLEDLDIDPGILTDLSFTGLDADGLPSFVGLDTDFKVKVENVPAYIEIVTQPVKLRYIEGSRIDLTGMVVTAKKSDGSTWTSAKYPNGHIPLGELILTPQVATEGGQIATNTSGGYFCHVSSSAYDRTFTKTSGGRAYGGMIISTDGWYTPFLAADTADAVHLHCEDVKSPSFTMDSGPSGSMVVHGLRVYYYYGYGLKEGSSGSGVGGSGISVHSGTVSDVLEEVVAGDGEGMITISWPRPGDGMMLSALFEIEVIPKGHGGGR